MAIHVLDLEFGHLVSSDLYTYRMPSEEKKAEYAATKKAKRHLAKWEADPKTQALQAELRGVRATERFNRAAMHFEDIYSEWLRHLSREHDKRLLAESKMRCAEEELADVRSREFERMEACKRRAEEAVARNEERDARILYETEAHYEDKITKYGCHFCKCRLCEERRKNPFPPSSDEEEEDIFLDPKDLPVSSPLRKIQRGRGGDRRSKQFKKDRRERIRAIRRGEGGRK